LSLTTTALLSVARLIATSILRAMAKYSNIKVFFDGIRKRIDDRAEQNFIESLPMLAGILDDYAREELKRRKKASMTGNFVNSFGIALYRDGKFVAVGTTSDVEGTGPIQVTLAKGDAFLANRSRYDGRWQFHDFVAPEGTKRIFADQEVVKYLQRYPPTRKKGFSFRVATVVDYSDSVGGREVLLRFENDMEGYGGEVIRINLG